MKFLISDFILNTDRLVKKSNLNMNKLSEKSRISKGVLSDILNGHYEPSIQHLVGLSEALDVSINDLVKQN